MSQCSLLTWLSSATPEPHTTDLVTGSCRLLVCLGLHNLSMLYSDAAFQIILRNQGNIKSSKHPNVNPWFETTEVFAVCWHTGG